LRHGQRADGFAQGPPFSDAQADFAHARAEHRASGLHKVAQVYELAKDLVGFLANFLTTQEELYPAGAILQIGKNGLTHVTDTEQPAGEGDLGWLLAGGFFAPCSRLAGFKSGYGFGDGVRTLDTARVRLQAGLT